MYKKLTFISFDSTGITPTQLHNMLTERKFSTAPHVIKSTGFCNPVTKNGDGANVDVIRSIPGYDLAVAVSLRVESRLLPSSVVKSRVNDAVVNAEIQQGRALNKNEIQSIHDEVEFELIPQSFVLPRYINAIIDIPKSTIVIDSVDSEDVAMICAAFNDCGVNASIYTIDPIQITEWIVNKTFPNEFVLSGCTALVNGKKQTLQKTGFTQNKLAVLVEDGARIMSLSMYNDGLSFSLSVGGYLSNLQYLLDAPVRTYTDRYADFDKQNQHMCDQFFGGVSGGVIATLKRLLPPATL